MEDPEESEWEIQEYYYSSTKTGDNGSSSRVKWMLSEGFMMGKKLVITGFAISSAPLVVPPLVVFSAMGVAFSFPVGFVYASYTFTNKLMTTLLPTPSPSPPPPPLMLEYYYTPDKDEAIQLDDYNQQYVGDFITYGDDNNKDFGAGVDDKGYEEDVGEYLEGDDDSLEEPLIKVNMNSIQDVFEVEKEEIVKGSTGLLEKIRDEGSVDNVVEDDNLLSENASNLDDDDEVKDFEAKEPVMVKEISSEKLVDESKNGETVGEMRHVVILSGGNEENNFNSREVEEIEMVASEVVGDTNREVRKDESDEKVLRESMGTEERTGELDMVTGEVMGDASKIESDEEVMGERMITRGETGGNVSNDGSEDVILRTKKEHLIHSDSDAKGKGDESGMDLVDKRDTNIDLKNLEGGDEAKEVNADENVLESLPTFEEASLVTDDTKVASKTETKMKMPFREDSLDDEKIWEKIGAMRTIVGYNAPSQETCIGELKALYVFTGVEPPGSFKGDSDLDEVKAKLKFLMAIVGVK